MKVLLVQSPTGRIEDPIFPLGLAFLSSHLKAGGHLVEGLDLSISPRRRESLETVLARIRPDMVAVSLRNIDDSCWPVTWSYLDAFGEIMDELRSWQPGVLAVGGPGFSIYADRILSMWPRIDYGVVGDGEEALPELVMALEEGKPPPKGVIRGSMPRAESLLNPDYGLLPLSDYPGRGAVGVQSRRGCSFGCRYCTYGGIGGRVFRNRPVRAVLKDIRELENLGAGSFMFVDSVFDHPRSYAEDLVRALGESGCSLEWGAWLSESVPYPFLRDLWKAGCRWVDFSPDAITRRGLELLGKPSGGGSLYSLVRAARKTGFHVGVNFFNGNPGEGFPALILKFVFMLRARLFLGWRKTFVNIGTIRIYPGSPMADDLPENTDLLKPVFHRPRGLSGLLFRWFSTIRRRRHC